MTKAKASSPQQRALSRNSKVSEVFHQHFQRLRELTFVLEKNFFQSIVDLQCCVSFRYTTNEHVCVCVCVCVCVRAVCCAKWLQSCLPLCNLINCSPPGSSVHGILQARKPEWVVIPFSRASSQPRDGPCISYISWIGRRLR